MIVAIPASNTTGQTGAHLGVEGHASRANDFCRSFTYDCTTAEISATPDTWNCFVRNEFDVFFGPDTLTKVKENEDPFCSVFEDGEQLRADPSDRAPGRKL